MNPDGVAPKQWGNAPQADFSRVCMYDMGEISYLFSKWEIRNAFAYLRPKLTPTNPGIRIAMTSLATVSK